LCLPGVRVLQVQAVQQRHIREHVVSVLFVRHRHEIEVGLDLGYLDRLGTVLVSDAPSREDFERPPERVGEMLDFRDILQGRDANARLLEPLQCSEVPGMSWTLEPELQNLC
jgi:hypothetical protein